MTKSCFWTTYYPPKDDDNDLSPSSSKKQASLSSSVENKVHSPTGCAGIVNHVSSSSLAFPRSPLFGTHSTHTRVTLWMGHHKNQSVSYSVLATQLTSSVERPVTLMDGFYLGSDMNELAVTHDCGWILSWI